MTLILQTGVLSNATHIKATVRTDVLLTTHTVFSNVIFVALSALKRARASKTVQTDVMAVLRLFVSAKIQQLALTFSDARKR